MRNLEFDFTAPAPQSTVSECAAGPLRRPPPRFAPAELSKLKEVERMLANKFKTSPVKLNSCEQVKTYLTTRLAPLEHEEMHVIYLDVRHQLITTEVASKGTTSSAAVYPAEIARRALLSRAGAVILAHNHPTGGTKPSQADIAITDKIKKCLKLFDIKVLDHIIVGKANTYSFAEHGKM